MVLSFRRKKANIFNVQLQRRAWIFELFMNDLWNDIQILRSTTQKRQEKTQTTNYSLWNKWRTRFVLNRNSTWIFHSSANNNWTVDNFDWNKNVFKKTMWLTCTCTETYHSLCKKKNGKTIQEKLLPILKITQKLLKNISIYLKITIFLPHLSPPSLPLTVSSISSSHFLNIQELIIYLVIWLPK